ncbi:hypothetical protein [Wolbachia endosymbiont (group B) of Ischnura elegans]|uniref:hypothetical protein n=1 Tax=Wolbachia endosymbiont (group B) of Ischnura elegans TaxID=2954021 RepID=UPI00222FAB12|nr:hypothetical protein [Wolbachia endosymbiont (group B) of Ischnura elegans]
MKFGAIVGITAGVGVGNGLFAAAGLSLLISAFIGAAVAIASNRVCCFWYYICNVKAGS